MAQALEPTGASTFGMAFWNFWETLLTTSCASIASTVHRTLPARKFQPQQSQ